MSMNHASPTGASSRPETWIAIVLLVAAVVAFGLVIVQDFASPLVGRGDTNIWEFTGYYLQKHLHASLWSTVTLESDDVFYPYGTNCVFQPWGLERDFFYAMMSSSFGPGPWLKIYYLSSLFISSGGVFLLARRKLGWQRALALGITCTYFNFAAIQKYPGHFGYAIFHWTTISVVLDYLAVRRVVRGEHLSARFLLFRVLLTVLCLGQDLTYSAGLALLSLAVSWSFILVVLAYASAGSRTAALAGFRRLVADLRTTRWQCAVLVASSAIGVLAYVPLLLQIVEAAGRIDISGLPTGRWWVNPLRVGVPYLPGLNPRAAVLHNLFGDQQEAWPQGSPGWFLLLVGFVGLWRSQNRKAFIPIALTTALCMAYVPPSIRPLEVFPWFEYFRVGGRVSVLYPVFLAIAASQMRWSSRSGALRFWIPAAMLGLVELVTFFELQLRGRSDGRLSADAEAFFATIRRSPGEAVLDWPFCAVGGNGIGGRISCPQYARSNGIPSLARFHTKKVLGQYFGRLHPKQLAPYFEAGWQGLLETVDPETTGPRCLTEHQWAFMMDFYRAGNFAGLNLYPDLVGEECAESFRTKLGMPSAKTRVPGPGRIEFFEKPEAWRAEENRTRLVSMQLESPSPAH